MAIVVLLAVGACGGIPTAARFAADSGQQTSAGQGDPEGRPGMDILPRLSDDTPGYTERARQGLMMARTTFKAKMPAPPVDRAFAELQRWINTEVVQWIEQRNRAIEATRYAFNRPAQPSTGEEVLAHAVIGLLREDMALALVAIPAPSELDDEPDIAEIYAEVVAKQSIPFVTAALVEYRECANIAMEGPRGLRPWARFCAIRFQRLREAHYPEPETNPGR